MINRRTVLGLLASASVIAPAGLAFAKQHHHKNGKDLLGAKLKQNGKHNVDKIGSAPVSAGERKSAISPGLRRLLRLVLR
jgi:hypothetical protein